MLCFFSLSSIAQKTVELTANKVAQFIFTSEIKDVRGGYLPDDILSEVRGNVLYMQPVASFPETNLNIVTVDDRYYTFNLRYNKDAKTLNYIIAPEDAIFSSGKNTGKAKDGYSDDPNLKRIAESILSSNGWLNSRNAARYKKTSMYLKGVYVNGNKLFFRMLFENSSDIRYDFDFVSFVVKPKKQSKKSGMDAVQMKPTNIYKDSKILQPNSSIEIIYEFDKFTIGKEKILFIEMIEKGGERNISLPIDNKILIDARYVE